MGPDMDAMQPAQEAYDAEVRGVACMNRSDFAGGLREFVAARALHEEAAGAASVDAGGKCAEGITR